MFIYGDVTKKEVTDQKLFKEMKKEQFRETVGDTLNRLALRRIKEQRFSMGDRKPSRRKPFLMRGIEANVQLAIA